MCDWMMQIICHVGWRMVWCKASKDVCAWHAAEHAIHMRAAYTTSVERYVLVCWCQQNRNAYQLQSYMPLDTDHLR